MPKKYIIKDVAYVCGKCKLLEKTTHSDRCYLCGIDGHYRWSYIIGPSKFICPHDQATKDRYYRYRIEKDSMY
jgi:hypothetical protein